MATFTATLFRHATAGGWHFVEVPAALAPPVAGHFGMTPVVATLDGRTWKTTTWREAAGRVLLPAPKKVRGKKVAGDEVEVEVEADLLRVRDVPRPAR